MPLGNEHDSLDEKLEKLEKMMEQDHKMIRSLYIRARLASILRIIYILILIGLAVGGYYFIEPYLNEVKEIYRSIKATQSQLTPQGIMDWFRATSTPQ